MSKSAQLKRKAAEFEQKRQYDRALTSYTQAIEAAAGIPDELDIPLYNRVGDLHLRMGDLVKAITFYERAVDLYAEGGFFNNAIALCNKVLRHDPGRTVIYYKLGKISARKGFNSDAKQNFLEYASRMERAGDISEAFRSLKEFADLCPGEDDVRLMLAEQLARADRVPEALEQLQTVYEAMLAEDRRAEAAATLARIRTLDPNFAPSAGRSRQQEKREGLVFIDVDYEEPPADVVDVAGHAELEQPDQSSERPLSALKFGEVDLPAAADVHATRTLDESPLAGLTPIEDPYVRLAEDAASQPETLLEFEPTSFDAGSFDRPMENLAIEHTSYDSGSRPAAETDSGVIPDPSAPTLGDAVSGYVESLSADVGAIEGGLPADLGILPLDAISEEQLSGSPIRSDDEFVDLTEWLLESADGNDQRAASAGNEAAQSDFSNMLETFKAGVAANVDDSDSDSHYDLGVAYMEMGLFDEAVSQFQKAMRTESSAERRVRAYESLGQCLIEKGSYDAAVNSLLEESGASGLDDAQLVGVLYLLGYASERLSRWPEAAGYYRRVFAVDSQFRDIGERFKRAEQMQ